MSKCQPEHSARIWQAMGILTVRDNLYSQGIYSLVEITLCVNCHIHNANQPSLVLVLKWTPLSETNVSGEKGTV